MRAPSYSPFICKRLYNKKIYKIINTNNCKLAHIIQWNNKYSIVADVNNKSFKVIDLEENKNICDIGGQHSKEVICIKKIYHPLYGESLLSAGNDNIIKLWSILFCYVKIKYSKKYFFIISYKQKKIIIHIFIIFI